MIHLQRRVLPLACLSLLCLSSLAQAQKYDASALFSASNPSSVYDYGYESTLGGAFNLYGTYTANYNAPSSNKTLQEWSASQGSLPAIFHNSGSVFTQQAGSTVITLEADQLALHPGAGGEYSVLRFTAPKAGLYSISSLFNAADSTPTTTDVHVLIGNSSKFDGVINNQNGMVGGNANYAGLLQLTKGETVDFAVGFGTNGTYYSDTTGLFANVTAVPELSTMLGFGSFVALGGLAAFRQRKQTREVA